MLFTQFGAIKGLQLIEELLALTALRIKIQNTDIKRVPLKLLGETTLNRVGPKKTLMVRVNNEDFCSCAVATALKISAMKNRKSGTSTP